MKLQHTAILLVFTLLFLGYAQTGRANLITWSIDSAHSSLKMAIPDTPLDFNGVGVTIGFRNQATAPGANSVWNIGNTAFMSGTIKTDYHEVGVNSIRFLANDPGSWLGVNSGNYRPNPAAFNAANTNSANPDGQFANASLSPGVFGGRVVAGAGILTNATAAYFSIYDVHYDANSAAIPIAGTVFAANGIQIGIPQCLIDFDGTSVPVVGQPFPDTHALLQTNMVELDSAPSGTITNLGGQLRQLTLPIDISTQIIIETSTYSYLPIHLTGTIVAQAMVPEPATVTTAALGLACLLAATGAKRARGAPRRRRQPS